jgi:hypothetical protein
MESGDVKRRKEGEGPFSHVVALGDRGPAKREQGMHWDSLQESGSSSFKYQLNLIVLNMISRLNKLGLLLHSYIYLYSSGCWLHQA